MRTVPDDSCACGRVGGFTVHMPRLPAGYHVNAAMCSAFLAALVSAGVWLKARQARCVINRCIATTLADIGRARLELVDAKVWLARYDLEHWDDEMAEHLGELHDES
jgi:hypothetical protein